VLAICVDLRCRAVAPRNGRHARSAAPRYGAPPEPMGGRWQLARPAQPVRDDVRARRPKAKARSRRRRLPGNFFTSRKWTFEQARSSSATTTASRSASSRGRARRFDGKATNGQPVLLSR
jgi:hypothetical protein